MTRLGEWIGEWIGELWRRWRAPPEEAPLSIGVARRVLDTCWDVEYRFGADRIATVVSFWTETVPTEEHVGVLKQLEADYIALAPDVIETVLATFGEYVLPGTTAAEIELLGVTIIDHARQELTYVYSQWDDGWVTVCLLDGRIDEAWMGD